MIQGQSKGIKSSEFLLCCIALIMGGVGAVWSDSQLVQGICGLIAMVSPTAYAASRAAVKRALVSSQGLQEVAKLGKLQD
jgi:hypothetical protein